MAELCMQTQTLSVINGKDKELRREAGLGDTRRLGKTTMGQGRMRQECSTQGWIRSKTVDCLRKRRVGDTALLGDERRMGVKRTRQKLTKENTDQENRNKLQIGLKLLKKGT